MSRPEVTDTAAVWPEDFNVRTSDPASPVSAVVADWMRTDAELVPDSDLTERVRRNNGLLRRVVVDAAARELMRREPDIVTELESIAGRISADVPGSMHVQAFESDRVRQSGLSTYLAGLYSGEKLLVVSGRQRIATLIRGLNYEISVLTTEMGHGISGYGGIGTYMQSLLPYLAEYVRVIEIGWDDAGRRLQSREIGYCELKEPSGPAEPFLTTLRFYGVKKEPAQGFGIVRQAAELARTMADYVCSEHPQSLLSYVQVWYNGAAVPRLRCRLPDQAVAAMFHSVQPGKYWKAGDIGGAFGQWYANRFEAHYAGADGIVAMSEGNAAEIVQFYDRQQPAINADHFNWLCPDRSAALLADLAANGYIHQNGETTWRLTAAACELLAAHAVWWDHFIAQLASVGLAEDGMPAAELLAEDRQRLQALCVEFGRTHPRPLPALSPEFQSLAGDILLLLDYPRTEQVRKKIRIISHGISGESVDVPRIARSEAFTVVGELARRHLGSNPGKTQSVPVLLRQAEQGTRKILAYIGRLSGQKGLHLLVDALQYLDPDSYLLILVASSPDSPQMQRLAEGVIPQHQNILWIPEHIKSAREVDSVRAVADVFVLPSTNEPFGLVIPEAFRSRLPVVALKGSGGPDYIIRDIRRYGAQSNGALADAHTPPALAQAIQSVLSLSPERTAQLRDAAFADFRQRYQLRTGAAPQTFAYFEALILRKQRERFRRVSAQLSAELPTGATRRIAVDSEEFFRYFGLLCAAVLLSRGIDELVLAA